MSRFQNVLQAALRYLLSFDPTQVALAKEIGVDPSVMNHWIKKGSTESLKTARVIETAARLAGLLMDKGNWELFDQFVYGYREGEWTARALNTIKDGIKELGPIGKSERWRWVHLLIGLQILAEAKRWDEAFLIGSRKWNEEAQRNMPLSYRLREVICEAKSHASKETLAEIAREAGAMIGLSDPVLSLEDFVDEPWGKPVSPSSLPHVRGAPWIGHKTNGVMRFARCQVIDSLLQCGALSDVQLQLGFSEYEVPKKWHSFGWLAMERAFRAQGDLFEASTVKFCSPGVSQLTTGSCRIERTSYFRDVVTTQSLPFCFTNKRTKEKVAIDGQGASADQLGQLSAQIGIGSVVITRDLHLVAQFQSRKNRTYSDKLVPFGGSMDFNDAFIELARSGSVGGLVIRALDREVREECQIKVGSARHLLLGLTLDLTLGLKPDFLGLSFVNADFQEVEANVEPVYGHVLRGARIQVGLPEEYERSLQNAEAEWAPHCGDFLVENLTLLRSAYSLVKKLIG